MFARHVPTRATLSVAAWLAALSVSCGADPGATLPIGDPAAGSLAGTAGSPAGGAPAMGVGGAPSPLGTPRCRPPVGMNGSPQTIEAAVALLNALPKPTSAACFVQSLDRPLTVYATNSALSAQPALSARSPRVFIKIDRLWASVVVDGDSSYLLELSYLEPDGVRSVKGEVLTPVNEPLALSAPYDRVHYAAGTVCGVCHRDEQPALDTSLTGAFASTPYRPRSETRVSWDALLIERQLCDWSVEPHRCEMLSALFDGGATVEQPFPATMDTFY